MQFSRATAIILVTLLNALVLCGVWAAVVSVLPPTAYEDVLLLALRGHSAGGGELAGRPARSPAAMEAGELMTLPAPDPLPMPLREVRPARPADVPLQVELRCESEISSICPGLSVEERRHCMQSGLRKLSAACQPRAREELIRMRVSVAQIRAACEGDVRRFCPDVSAGGGAILQCLEANAQAVSEPCFDLLPKRGRLLK